MVWLVLVLAGLFEVGMVMGLNLSDGFTRLWPSLMTLVFGGASFLLLSVAMRSVPVGTAYAVWTGIGAVGAVVLGIVLFKEPAGLLRLGAIALIVAGVVALRFTEA